MGTGGSKELLQISPRHYGLCVCMCMGVCVCACVCAVRLIVGGCWRVKRDMYRESVCTEGLAELV